MWTVVLRNVTAHKVRVALTALAVMLGVAFVAGTYILTDTIDRTLSEIFVQTTHGIDVAVRTKQAFTGDNSKQRTPIPASALDKIRAVAGVHTLEGTVVGYAQFIGKDGKPIEANGAGTVGGSVASTPQLRGGMTVADGRYPHGPDEVAMDAYTARKHGFHVHDQVKVLFADSSAEFTITGILRFGNADNLVGMTFAGFETATAQQMLHRRDSYDEIDVVAAPGVAPVQLRDRISAVVDPSLEVLTGRQLAQQNANAVAQVTGFVNAALLSFAFVALFVGSFIIVNSFAITIAQRTRELALLRCIGADKRQVLTMVLGEAAIIGAAASVLGLGAGVLMANALRSAFGMVGLDLPPTSTVIRPRTVAVSLLVGVLVTLLSSLLPALKATRVPPMPAMREDAVPTVRARLSRKRVLTGTLFTGIGLVLLLPALVTESGGRLAGVGAGAVLIFVGGGLLSPLVAAPLARLIGWPFLHLAGEPGRLARANAMRNAKRTASSAAALMVGLALVSLVAILAASLKNSATAVLDRSVVADYIVTGPAGAQGFSPEVARRLGQQPELETATGVRRGAFKLNGEDLQTTAVDPVEYARTVRTETTQGSLASLTYGGVAVRADVAKQHAWKVGDLLAMDFPVGGSEQVPISAIYQDNQVNGQYLLAIVNYQRHYAEQVDVTVFVKVKPGVPPDMSRKAVERVTVGFSNLQIQDRAQFKADQTSWIDQLVTLFYLLLTLTVVIAFIGIVNTLVLSILERTRELGLLRAVGMTKRQVMLMIRWEAVIVAMLGAVLGLLVGTFFGWILVRVLQDDGVRDFTLPVRTLLVFVLAAAIAGYLAAIIPARQTFKIDILAAIHRE